MDLALKKASETKVALQVGIYPSTLEELQQIAEKESVKVTHIVRHCLNIFIADYKTKEMKHAD